MKAIERPSGDHAGAISNGSNESGVSRRGVPSGRSMIQTRPTAWKASRLPSGEEAAQRGNFTLKVSPSAICGRPAISEIVRCTRAVKGIVATAPSRSTRRIFPPAETTSECESEAQLYPGRSRDTFIPSAMSTSMGSMRTRSAPVSRSRSQSAVRGPKRCPSWEIVPSGMRRPKASQRPSGDGSGAIAPPLDVCPCWTVMPEVISSTRPVSRSRRRICLCPCVMSSRPDPSPGGAARKWK